MCGPLLPHPLLALGATGDCLHGGVAGWIHQPLRVVSVWVAQPHALGVCAVRAVGESKTLNDERGVLVREG